MLVLSPKQQEIRERETRILAVAEEILLADGYYGMTMARIAVASDCPTGTVYQHFASKEDVVLALALRCQQTRLDLFRRGASFTGRARERMAGVGEAAAIFVHLYPRQSRIIHNAGGPLREKASPMRTEAMARADGQSVGIVRGIVQDAVDQGDLTLTGDNTVARIAYVLSALVDGGYTMMENGVTQEVLGLGDPSREMWRAFNTLADAYGWRPLYSEVDWEETLAHVRREAFPEETERLYGSGCWYGRHGNTHPKKSAPPVGPR